jgi:PPM family protein phosphatase
VRFVTGRATDQGRIRDNNEDALLVDDDHTLFAVADGMGGHQGGEVASHTAIEALRAAFAGGSSIDAAITRANDAVFARAAGNDELTGMGTTLTALTAENDHVLIGHVGDSRAYLLHDGTLQRVTNDHSLVEELVRDGRLTPEQAESHPRRAIVTRALGVDREVDVDMYRVDVVVGDRVLLCSDGLNTMLRERDIERIARTELDPQHAADALVAAANAAGGEDNTTVLGIDVAEVGAAAPATPGTDEHHTSVGPPAPAPVPRRTRSAGSGLRTVRGVILVMLPIVVILGVAAGVLGWYARGSYYVGASGNEVVIYKGVPGGVVGWNPTVDERTGISLASLPPLDRGRVQTNATRGSLETARGYVSRLRDEATAATSTTTTTKPKSKPKPKTTTTVRKPTTPTTRKKP